MSKVNNIHLVLQGKGGVGKSAVAVFIAQWLQNKGERLICADTDPVNASFAQYLSLDVAHIEIAKDGNVIQSKFDPLIEKIVGNNEANFVIDNGAATFLPLTKYLVENDIYQIFSDAGKKVYIHCVLTGGQAKTDTYNGFAELLSKVNKYAKVVVWENEFWGPVEYEGRSITETKLYKEADKAGKIAGIVKIIDRSNSDAFVEDFAKMTSNHMTIKDVMDSGDFNFLAKNRLTKIVNAVFSELDQVKW